MRRVLLAVAVLGIVATGCSLKVDDAGTAGSATNMNQSSLPPVKGDRVTAVVQRVLPAVVNVTTDLLQSDQFGNTQQGQGVGTGFIVRGDGIIVTNCHVVEGATAINVFTSAANPVRYDARVIGGDCLHDLAILKVDATGLPTVPLGDSSTLKLGQSVVALGYALALEGGPTVTEGIVSALDRTIKAQDPGCTSCPNFTRTYSDVIQTDAAINHGNSGGPLVDLSGRVVGINSAGNDQAQNIGFAIAINTAADAIHQAIADPLAPSAYLGVSPQGVTPQLAFQLGLSVESGAYVLATFSDGPAAAAGIRQGDIIVSIDGRTVANENDLGDILSSLHPGDTVAVELVSPSGARRTVQVTLGTRPLPAQLP